MKPPNGSLPFHVKLQRMFYIIPPSDSMFEHLDDVPNYVDGSSSAFQMLMVLEMVLLWIQCKSMPRVSDVISSVGAGIASRFTGLFVKRAVEIATYCYVWDNYRLYELPWDSVWTWVAAMFGVDLGYYWVHRFAHEINFMWAAHQTHHSSEDYNLTTALRQSVLQSYSSWMFYLPLALFIPPPIYQVHIQFNLLYQFWIHTEVVGWLGPLEYIINTPSAHRVHHGRNRYCIDKNYGGTFIIFDILFGTYEAEKRDDINDRVVYGLVHPLESRDPIYTQLCHWQYILTTAWNRPGLINKAKTLLYGPGWEPGKPRLGEKTDIPDIHYPQPKYETPAPLWYNVYSVVHFIPVFAIHQIAHENLELLSQTHVMLSIAFMLTTLTCLGAKFDKRWYASVLELARCLTVAVYLSANLELASPQLTLPLLLLFSASTLLFSGIVFKELCAPQQVDKSE
ncbi:alkylglycerol monooxygenase-like [Watersipora subatra]|uniref:alkylglycerol monooxygenase-like n=1 Tax=Watersipora subatra TaxID=2589382 RepID=UPI00355C9C00